MCILFLSTPLQFGLKAFYRRHEEVIAEIILQQELCVKELAVIEESLDLNTDSKHFKRRMQMEGHLNGVRKSWGVYLLIALIDDDPAKSLP